jgi:hypothetical protein
VKFVNPDASETIAPDLGTPFGSQSLTEESEAGEDPSSAGTMAHDLPSVHPERVQVTWHSRLKPPLPPLFDTRRYKRKLTMAIGRGGLQIRRLYLTGGIHSESM